MKFVRYGAIGQEKPGLIDKSGQLRDLSGQIKELNGEAYAPASLAKLALASVYRSEKKDAQAIDTYKQLIDKPTISVNKVTAQLELASFYEGRQKTDEAKRIYDQIQKENPATEAATLAQQRAGKLK